MAWVKRSEGHGVLSFEDMRSDKINAPYVLNLLHVAKVNIISMPNTTYHDVLLRLSLANNEMENMLFSYIPEDSPYWEEIPEIKKALRYEYLRVPANQWKAREAYNEWSHMLNKVEFELELLFKRHAKARL